MKAFEGIRVIDFTQTHGGSATTMHLADFGADVIKVERPSSGDPARYWYPIKDGESAYFALLNRGKKSITLDIRSEEGKKIALQLIKDADIVVENFKIGTMEKAGLGYDDLIKLNPKLIYAQMSGYGSNGPKKDYPAYDICIQAASGMMDVTGFQDGPPTKIGPAVGDYFAATYLTSGIAMALLTREKTGKGQKVEVSMTDALISALEDKFAHYSIAKEMPRRVGNAHPMIAPYDTFKTKDAFVALGVSTDDQWEKFCEAIKRTDLAKDERYITNELRGKNYFTSLREELEKETVKYTTEELLSVAKDYYIPAGQVKTVKEALENPQVQYRDMLLEVDDKLVGKIKQPGIPLKFHKTPAEVKCGSPILSEHTNEVLKTLGYSEEEIKKLHENHVI